VLTGARLGNELVQPEPELEKERPVALRPATDPAPRSERLREPPQQLITDLRLLLVQGEQLYQVTRYGEALDFLGQVKTRANENFGPSESAVTSAKKTRMLRAARYFLATHQIEDRPYRFDVVTIVLADKGPAQIRHYENAFVP